MTLQEYIEERLPREFHRVFREAWEAAHPQFNPGLSTDYLSLPGRYTKAEHEVLLVFFGAEGIPPYPTQEELFPERPTLWEHLGLV